MNKVFEKGWENTTQAHEIYFNSFVIREMQIKTMSDLPKSQ